MRPRVLGRSSMKRVPPSAGIPRRVPSPPSRPRLAARCLRRYLSARRAAIMALARSRWSVAAPWSAIRCSSRSRPFDRSEAAVPSGGPCSSSNPPNSPGRTRAPGPAACEAAGMSTATATTTGRLLNPADYDAAEFDPATQRLFRATIDWFEAKGKRDSPPRHGPTAGTSDFIEFLAGERAFATLLTPWRDAAGRPRQALGHRAQRAVQRDPRVLRAALLVRVAGHHPRARPDLAERQRRPPAAAPRSCSRTARCSPSASPSATTAPTSTRPT